MTGDIYNNMDKVVIKFWRLKLSTKKLGTKIYSQDKILNKKTFSRMFYFFFNLGNLF